LIVPVQALPDGKLQPPALSLARKQVTLQNRSLLYQGAVSRLTPACDCNHMESICTLQVSAIKRAFSTHQECLVARWRIRAPRIAGNRICATIPTTYTAVRQFPTRRS